MTRAAHEPSRRGPIDPRVLGLSSALRVHLVVCVAVAGAVAAAVLVQAEALSRLLPRLVAGDGSATRPLVLWLVGAGLVRGAAAAVTERSATVALVATRRTVRRQVLDHLARLRPDQRPALGPARVSALTTTAIDSLEPWVRSYLPGLTLAVVVPLSAGARILGADLTSALILAVVVPLIPVFMVLIGRFTESQAARQWDALQRLAGRFLDVLTGLPTLRLFGRAEAQVERVRVVTDRYRQATMRTLRVAFLSALVLELLATVSVALVAVSLGVRLTHAGLSLQVALVVLLLTPECLLPIRRVGAAFHAATAGLDAAVEITGALALPIRPEGTAELPGSGSLRATGVAVHDPVRGARLAPVDLSVAPGQVVAVGGPSGAGKSTLLDVLRGALAADAGQVLLGAVAISDLPLGARAQAVRWVPQSPQPLGGTVHASAGLGNAAASAAEVDAVLGELGLADLAAATPAEVSGGERRRLALARALLAARCGAARYVLLDEPTAQLDAASAQLVTAAIRSMATAGVGVVVATHDPDLLGAADQVVTISSDVRTDHGPAIPVPARTAPEHHMARHEVLPLQVPTAHLAAPDLPGDGPELAQSRAQSRDGGGVPRPGTRRSLTWVLRAARPHRTRMLGAQALGVLTELCSIGLAATAAWLVVRAAERPSFADLAVAAVGVRAFGLGKGPLRYAERMASHDATLRLLADLRATVVERLVRLAPTGLPEGGRGELLGRVVDDIDRLQDLFLRVLGPLVSTLVVAAGAALVAGLIDPAAGAVLGAAVVFAGVLLPAAAHRGARHRGRLAATARGRVTATTVDLAEHVEELVACGAESAWRQAIDQHGDAVDGLERRQARSTALVAGLAAAGPALATAAVVAAAGASRGGLSGPALGVVVLLPLAVIELLGPLSTAGEVLAKVEASAGRVRALLDRPDPVAEPDRPAAPPAAADLTLHRASLGWPGAPAQVTGVELAVAEGEQVALTGPSGSGKSTLAATLVSFLAPTAGSYQVGDVAASALGGEAVRRLVTWCQQEPWFADSTLADNLRVAQPTAHDDELWQALEIVHLDGWARALPAGLETRLERDASAMSGGERQRLALARVLLGGHRAVVLDEPTAHLDAETAAVVLRDLLAASSDKAVVVIAHDDAAAQIDRTYRLVSHRGAASTWHAPPA